MKKHAKKWLAMALSLSVACMMLPAVGFAAGNVASVDGTEYATVQQAVDNANGKTVVLLDNVTESITIANGQTITLDLGGYTLTNTAKQHTITNNGTLTIQGSGKVDNVDHGKGALVNNGEVTIAGGTLTRSQEKGTDATTSGGNSWYVVDNHDTITMKGGQIINTSGFSSLVRNIGATFNLENVTLQNTFIVLKNDDNGVFNMTGGKVVTTGSQGSALQNWGKATISGGTLSATGGGVALQALEWDKKYQSVTEVKAGATVDGDVLVRQDPDYNTGEIEFTVTGGTINGNVTAGAGAEVALEGGSVSGALGTIADSGKLVVSGGSYAQSPAKYLAADAAAAGIGLKVSTFAGMPCWALGYGVTAMVGQNLGAGDPDRVRQTVRSGLLLSLGATALLTALVQLAAAPIIALFEPENAAVTAEGVRYLRICCSVNGLIYAAMYVFDSFAIGSGASWVAMCNAMLDAALLRLPLCWLLAFPLALGPAGIYLGQAFSPILPALAGLCYFRLRCRRS